MIKTYIISGFLGAGKTSFIKHLLKEASFEKVMLLENEFGEEDIDGKLFDDSLKVKTINSGCICCSLKGDLANSLDEIAKMDIKTLIIEPSGVGKLSEIVKSIDENHQFVLKSHIALVDVKKAKIYHKNYKEYFDDQVKMANCIILTKTDLTGIEKVEEAKAIIKELNDKADIMTKHYSELTIDEILDMIEVCECENCLSMDEVDELLDHLHHHEHHHHHDHDHHHHHHDEGFMSKSFKTDKTFTKEMILDFLEYLKASNHVVRCKGYLKGNDTYYYFDLSGEDIIINEGKNMNSGVIVVIGEDLNHLNYEVLND